MPRDRHYVTAMAAVSTTWPSFRYHAVYVVSDPILDLSVTSAEHRQVWLSSLMFVPIHPKHPKPEVEYILRDSAADIVLVHPSLRSWP